MSPRSLRPSSPPTATPTAAPPDLKKQDSLRIFKAFAKAVVIDWTPKAPAWQRRVAADLRNVTSHDKQEAAEADLLPGWHEALKSFRTRPRMASSYEVLQAMRGSKEAYFALKLLQMALVERKAPLLCLRTSKVRAPFDKSQSAACRLESIIHPHEQHKVGEAPSLAPHFATSQVSDTPASSKGPLPSRFPLQALIKQLKFLAKQETIHARFPVSMNLKTVLRYEKTKTLTRRKAYYHRWLAVVRCELLKKVSATRWTDIHRSWVPAAVYANLVQYHSLGTERLSGSKAFLYKATIQRRRDIEERMVEFKVRGRVGGVAMG